MDNPDAKAAPGDTAPQSPRRVVSVSDELRSRGMGSRHDGGGALERSNVGDRVDAPNHAGDQSDPLWSVVRVAHRLYSRRRVRPEHFKRVAAGHTAHRASSVATPRAPEHRVSEDPIRSTYAWVRGGCAGGRIRLDTRPFLGGRWLWIAAPVPGARPRRCEAQGQRVRIRGQASVSAYCARPLPNDQFSGVTSTRLMTMSSCRMSTRSCRPAATAA
jgi:hypothetical protein